MRKFEYKAVPAPTAGAKEKGVKTTGDRFALAITNLLNEMAGEGWEYVRAETLPCVERKGLTGSQQTYQNILVFRRLIQAALPLDRTTSRPLSPVQDLGDAEDADAPNDARRLTSRPPEAGSAPSIRAVED